MIALLIIIYIGFISLGLPDPLLGALWPVMSVSLGASAPSAGIISFIICLGTIISSLISNRLHGKFRAGTIVLASVFSMAAALLGISFARSFVFVCICAVPLGLGAGGVDTALNNFVAKHYKAAHMSWLHCFWGVGATITPIITSVFIGQGDNWQGGYRVIAVIQLMICVVLLASLPLWKKAELRSSAPSQPDSHMVTNREVLRVRGVMPALAGFACYCGCESAMGLWAASFLVTAKGVDTETAARWASLFYIGITVGRGLCGIIALRVPSRLLIRCGCALAAVGAVMLFLPVSNIFSFAGLILIGFGVAPYYPCMMHETPRRFGEKYAGAAVGLQMATAYSGSLLIPPVIGFVCGNLSFMIYPLIILGLAAGALFFSERAGWASRD